VSARGRADDHGDDDIWICVSPHHARVFYDRIMTVADELLHWPAGAVTYGVPR
jgi:hypothetical protein